MKYQDPKLIDLLAAEYALGTLKGSARRRFLKLVLAHPDLHRQMEKWELRINRLAQRAKPVTPPEAVWTQIERRLFTAAASAPLPWYQNLAFWRGITVASTALAAGLAFILVLAPRFHEAPAYVVIINDTAQKPMWTVSVSSDMDKFHVRSLKPMGMPTNMGCLLWVQPAGSQALYPLGILPDKGDEMTLRVAEDMRGMLHDGKLLVTVEHRDEPMPAAPSGPPQYLGTWVPITKTRI
ncbi:MAG: anti-sigma factor [Gammaproteobacteria bacterium]